MLLDSEDVKLGRALDRLTRELELTADAIRELHVNLRVAVPCAQGSLLWGKHETLGIWYWTLLYAEPGGEAVPLESTSAVVRIAAVSCIARLVRELHRELTKEHDMETETSRSIFLSTGPLDVVGSSVRIRDAVEALVRFVLPRGKLVWAGHPAIVPLVQHNLMVMGREGIATMSSLQHQLRTYQSMYFREVVTGIAGEVLTPPGQDLNQSLEIMRQSMLSRQDLVAAVFIGGRRGVEVEHELFTSIHPGVPAFALASTCGAAQVIWERAPHPDPAVQQRLRKDRLYNLLFEDLLGPLLTCTSAEGVTLSGGAS